MNERKQPSRDTFNKIFIPGYGPIKDALSTRSLNPADWSADTMKGMALQSAIFLNACSGPQESFAGFSVEASRDYVLKEIAATQGLQSLKEFDHTRLIRFTGHGYNLFRSLTHSAVNPDELLNKTEIGGNMETRQAIADERKYMQSHSPITDNEVSGHGAKTYLKNGEWGNWRMLYNLDSPNLKRGATDNPLKAMLFAVTHEPFHFEEDKSSFPAKVFRATDGVFTYTAAEGFSLIGKLNGGETLSYGTNFDECTVYHLQDKMVRPNIPGYVMLAGISAEKVAIAIDFLSQYGYKTPEDILTLRRSGGVQKLLGDIAQQVPPQFIPRSMSAQDVAFFGYFGYVDSLIGGNMPASQIRNELKTRQILR